MSWCGAQNKARTSRSGASPCSAALAAKALASRLARRIRPGAPVSAPLSWEELDVVAPDAVHLQEALERAQGADPWEGFFDHAHALK